MINIMSLFTKKLSSNYQRLSQDINDLEEIMYPFHDTHSQKKDNYMNIFRTTWRFIPDKRKYLTFLFVSELVGTLGMLGLLLESKFLIIISPLIFMFTSIFREKYFIEQGFEARKEFRRLAYDYFDNISYKERKSYENMTDFDDMVERSGRVICSIMDWGIPTISKMIITSISCLIVFYSKGYISLLPLVVGIYFLFYKFYIKRRQNNLVNIRSNKRKAYKKFVPVKRWISHLFQNRKRSVDELLINSNKMDSLDRNFVLEWCHISQMMSFISIFISSLGLYFVDD